ncbi:uncharacterized protein DNG_08857 [Cephalotrichum gorgonifer]|uniref:Nudix hydrolase domain-containing protein n=1 Tax=Cephalotrichum gorgonifer TaxID=2041049 RepID=A0AAE8N6D8_9PEZI|nr:uncharacterized protein DNG_08857 [Cephalotrichum gorgonifer]
MDQPQQQQPPNIPTPFTVPSSLAHYLRPGAPHSFPHLHSEPIDHFIASTFVFDPSGRLLLVQRSETDAFPLCWEIPGGCVDLEDPTVLHAAARELREEAGLTATAFVSCADSFADGRSPHVFIDEPPGEVARLWCRLAFLVEVEAAGEVVLDEREHRDFVWATAEELEEGRASGRDLVFATPAMREILIEGFRMKRVADGEA